MSENYSGERFLPNQCENEMIIEHYQRYQFASRYVEGKIVLDAACGEGYGSHLLAQKAAKVFGLDIDQDTVLSASKKYFQDNLDYYCGSIESLPFETDTFDVVISFETIEHVEETAQRKFLQEIQRVLRKDGILIISTPNKSVYTDLVKGKNRFHLKEFYVDEFHEFIKEYFSETKMFCQFPYTGYFLAEEARKYQLSLESICSSDSRYVIFVSSNISVEHPKLDKVLCEFDNSMYYFLNRQVHEMESKLIDIRNEAEAFQAQLEHSVAEQKEYISHLEKDLFETKKNAVHLEQDLHEIKNYVAHLETDLNEVKNYARELESQKRFLKVKGKKDV